MKKLIPVLIISAAAIAGCKKDSQSGNQSAIVGTWNLTAVEITLTNTDGTVLSDTTVANTNAGAYVQFNSDGTGLATEATVVSQGAPNPNQVAAGKFSYTLADNTLTVNYQQSTQPEVGTVSITKNTLVITEKEQETLGSTTINARIIEHYSKK